MQQKSIKKIDHEFEKDHTGVNGRVWSEERERTNNYILISKSKRSKKSATSSYSPLLLVISLFSPFLLSNDFFIMISDSSQFQKEMSLTVLGYTISDKEEMIKLSKTKKS